MLKMRSIQDLSLEALQGKRALVRVDFNVPFEGGRISDDARIQAAIPTISYLTERKAKVVLMTHVGRPKGAVVPELSVVPLAQRLSELLGQPVGTVSDCVGPDAALAVQGLADGGVLLLENVRFHAEETDNNPEFSKQLAELGDLFVQEAFGTAHRAHSSTAGVADYLPAYGGFLISKELEFLKGAVEAPKRPFVAIIGGAKVSSKIGVLENLLDKVDTLIIGGGMTFTFLKAQGLEVGTSLVEDDKLEEAKSFIVKSQTSQTRVILPIDQVVADTFSNEANRQVVSNNEIPDDAMGLDIGPESIQVIQGVLKEAQTVLWNGPLGVFEFSNFSEGTFSVARALADSSATTIIGGGDSAAAIARVGLTDRMSHISTGGGASLEYLEGKVLPGISILEAAYDAR